MHCLLNRKKDLPSILTCTVQRALFPEESVAVIRAVFTVPMSATVSRTTPVSEDVLDPCSTLLTKSRGSRVTIAASSGIRTVLDGLQDSSGGISSVIPIESEQWQDCRRFTNNYMQLLNIYKLPLCIVNYR